MTDGPISALILPAAHEERMHSARPQPLHLLCGRPMMQYVLDALGGVEVDRVVVVVRDGAERITKKLSEAAADPRLVFAEQRTGRGSAEAALAGLDVFAHDFGDDDVLVLPSNAPLLRAETVAALVEHHRASGLSATVMGVPLGSVEQVRRLVRGRDEGSVERISSDTTVADDPWLAYGGIGCFRRSLLAPAIRRIRPDHESGRFELSDVVEVLSTAGHRVGAFEHPDPVEVRAVDDRVQLAAAEHVIRRRTNLTWMRRGVTMLDPERTYIDTTVRLAPDVTLFPGTILQGATAIGPGAEIGPDTRLAACAVGSRATVEKTMGREAEVGEGAHVGPFAVLDPGSQVPPGTMTGPFYHATAPD